MFSLFRMLSKKPILFKSFTNLTVEELDNIYEKEMAKKIYQTENTTFIIQMKKRKDVIRIGRPFKLDLENIKIYSTAIENVYLFRQAI